MSDEETHPYNSVEDIPPTTKILIIGTAPPRRFAQRKATQGDVDFYYGSKSNQFWTKIFPQLFPRSFPQAISSVDALRLFLSDHEIWMHDICQVYTRTQNDALDRSLKPIQFSDLRLVLEEYPLINVLIFTGTTAETWAGRQMERQSLIPSEQFWKGLRSQKMPRKRRFRIALEKASREIETYTLPSPSRRSARGSVNDKVKLYERIIRQNLPGH